MAKKYSFEDVRTLMELAGHDLEEVLKTARETKSALALDVEKINVEVKNTEATLASLKVEKTLVDNHFRNVTALLAKFGG